MTATVDVARAGPGGRPEPITIRTDRRRDDRIFRGATRAAGFFALVILFLIGLFLFIHGWPALHYMGWRFFTTSGYNPTGAHPTFGVLASLYGTVVVALIALFFGVPVAISVALFLTVYAPPRVKGALIAVVDLAAAIPSIIFGLWALFEVQPNVAGTSLWISHHLSFIPIFRVTTPQVTSSFFIAGLVVAIMIVPIVTSISREVFSLTPLGEREAALALGSSRWQMIRSVIIPFGKGGMIGAVMLGMGRALEETIVVSLIVGGTFVISPHILQQGGSTISSLIATHFGAGGSLGLADLLMCGFVLFALTLLVNLVASFIVNRSRSGSGVEL